ncbi:hypothetical protein GCM10025864_26340 [Luteimicrobium album]|uniref:NodB homology domain-containing protein n=1 Tax=Luteimicrobium album TaxID=1054550 RepID=A0ABQ6I2Z2_9MICO|nr:polysaccharide deacetylase family protein [Luteimicrobium album]GMA24875.1 hypothetical protein GCM10025864_26340 [Luteimicrobium album]
MQLHLGWGLRSRVRRARPHVAAARMAVERHTLATVGHRRERPGGRILCYHSVGQHAVWGVNDVGAARFREQLERALGAGYRFVDATSIAVGGGGRKELALTFDDCPRSVLTTAAPILAEYGLPFSLFVVSDWSEGTAGPGDEAVLSWDDVVHVAELGGEIGNHSATHPDFATIGAGEAADEIGRASELIERRTGIAATSFAIPFGQSGNWPEHAARAAQELGYDVVYAQGEETRPPGTVARSFVTTFDRPRIWDALLEGRYDRWEEWF